MNTKARVALRKSYGFKTFEVYETVLYHELAKLPNRMSPTDSVNEAKDLNKILKTNQPSTTVLGNARRHVASSTDKRISPMG